MEERIQAVLESGRYILGEEGASFEAEFADYIGVRHCVGVASGTDVLMVGLSLAGPLARSRELPALQGAFPAWVREAEFVAGVTKLARSPCTG